MLSQAALRALSGAGPLEAARAPPPRPARAPLPREWLSSARALMTMRRPHLVP